MNQFKNKILLAVGSSLAVLIAITIFTVDEKTWIAIQDLNWIYLLLVAGAMLLTWLLNGIRLKVLAAGVDFKLPLLAAVEIGLVGRFFSNVTPSGIGGQPLKIIALTKTDISSGKASAIVVVELIFRLLFFSLSMPLVLINLKSVVTSYVSPVVLLSSITIFIILLGFIIYFLLYHPRYLVASWFWLLNTSLLSKLLKRSRRYSWKRAVAKEVRIFYQTIWLYLKDSKLQLLAGFILTALMWGSQFTVLYFIVIGFNLNASLIYLFALQLLVYTIVIFIPIPGGSGVEVVLASLLGQTLDSSLVGIIVATWRFFTYYTYIIFGGIVSFKVFNLGPELD
ncbi:MAG: lysylphosphatidylglycerol synthase transmembrane domain-containing protein [Halanaerobacter sp.]